MARRFGFLQIILILLAVFVILRFLPLILRLMQALAIAGRAYWWIILPAAIVGLAVLRIKRRRPQVRPPMRDVTNSLKDRDS